MWREHITSLPIVLLFLAAWIVGVCGYMDAESESERSKCRAIVDEMISSEMENSVQLQALLESDIELMATTDQEETPLIYGRKLSEALAKRIKLMSAHRDDEPFIDPEYIERNAGRTA